MPIPGWRPLSEFRDMKKEMQRLVDAFYQTVAPEKEEATAGWYPLVDIIETDEDFIISAEVPGMTRDDIKINISDNNLTLKGEKKEPENFKDQKYYRSERSYGPFSRTFSLPAQIDVEKAQANYKDGILTIMLPKKEEEKAKEIKISVG